MQTLCQNVNSNNSSVRDQGELLFNQLEIVCDPNNLVCPLVAQLNILNNNKNGKVVILERIIQLCHKIDKLQTIQKYVMPLLGPTHKIQTEAHGNVKLKDTLNKLQRTVNALFQ